MPSPNSIDGGVFIQALEEIDGTEVLPIEVNEGSVAGEDLEVEVLISGGATIDFFEEVAVLPNGIGREIEGGAALDAGDVSC